MDGGLGSKSRQCSSHSTGLSVIGLTLSIYLNLGDPWSSNLMKHSLATKGKGLFDSCRVVTEPFLGMGMKMGDLKGSRSPSDCSSKGVSMAISWQFTGYSVKMFHSMLPSRLQFLCWILDPASSVQTRQPLSLVKWPCWWCSIHLSGICSSTSGS